MNTQNILNYNIRKTDIVLDSSEYYDITLCNDQITIDENLLQPFPINYYPNSYNFEFTTPNSKLNTVTFNNHSESNPIIFTILFKDLTDYIETLIPNYKHTFLPTDSFNFTYNNVNDILYMSNFNEEINVDYFNGLSVSEILNMFNKTPIFSPSFDSNNPKKFIPYPIKTKIGVNEFINVREKSGWTWELLFNTNTLNWLLDDQSFLYLGVRGENNVKNFSDNILSFGFNSDYTIKWSKTQLSKICGTDFQYQTLSGNTKKIKPILNEDFLITIVFQRYYSLDGCDLLNKGGINDLIVDESKPDEHTLSQKWLNGSNWRKGRLSFYFNGKLLSHFDDWEELVMSNRGSQPYSIIFGGGIENLGSFYSGTTPVDLKKVKYYSKPLLFPYIKHNYLYSY